MHIELGIIEPVRLAVANATAFGLVATQLPALVKNPVNIPKTLISAVVFSFAMQIWHMPVGPSELHLICATSVYLLFGFTPAMLGFALGLFMQAVLFEPQDMLHLGVNALSLMVPMIAVHYSFGRRLFAKTMQDRFTLGKVLRLDATYYAGVSSMVGFWLMISHGNVHFADWAQWVVAYLPVFILEAMITFGAVMTIRHWRDAKPMMMLTEVGKLRFA